MKIAPAFSTGPLGQFASHKSVFFFVLLIENLAQTGQLAVTAAVPWVRIPPSPPNARVNAMYYGRS